MDTNLYREEILENFRNPQNFGTLSAFDFNSRQLNPFCGDEIEMFVKVNSGKVSNISFAGKGCAISIASASILTEYAKGKPLSKLKSFSEKDMMSLLEIEVSQTRKKCALLGWAVLQDCIGTIEDGK